MIKKTIFHHGYNSESGIIERRIYHQPMYPYLYTDSHLSWNVRTSGVTITMTTCWGSGGGCLCCVLWHCSYFTHASLWGRFGEALDDGTVVKVTAIVTGSFQRGVVRPEEANNCYATQEET